MGVLLSTDLSDPEAVPYFLWDALTLREFKELLRSASPDKRARLLGKLLREARDSDVWQFVSPADVFAEWQALVPHLGRRLGFWEFLLGKGRDSLEGSNGGLTPAQLAWVLSQIRIDDDLVAPGDVSARELRDYLHELTTRLTRLAFPETK